jgi:hypothetical protein
MTMWKKIADNDRILYRVSALAPRVAIIDDLRRQEAERLVAQSPVRRILRGIVRAVLFLLRPEYMTFYATAAPAFAAFLAVKAADRQERATFTSALYGKQVDILANIDSKLDRLGDRGPRNCFCATSTWLPKIGS